jgi:hypothetical protein
VAVIGTGLVIGVQAVTRYVYDHRTGFAENKVEFAKQAALDFGQDVKESWELVPLPTGVKVGMMLNPGLAPLLGQGVLATLLLHSKGWI